MSARSLISACLIVKDEEDCLARCLESVQGLVDEIVVVDTGSVDSTRDIARAHGAHVYEKPWQNDFALHRNQSIDYAGSTWCLVIDADEELVDTNVEETRWHLDGRVPHPVVAVHERLLLADGSDLVLLTPRLIRKDSGIRYRFPVHEQLHADADYEVSGSDINMVHYGYTSFASLCAKQERNLEIAKEMNDHPHGLHCQARALLSLDRYTETTEVCRQLAGARYGDVYTLEACGVGAAAAVRLGDVAALREFIGIGKAVASDSPDIALMEFIEAGYRYLEILEENGLGDDVEYLRPLVFRHSVAAMNKLLDLFASRRAVVRV